MSQHMSSRRFGRGLAAVTAFGIGALGLLAGGTAAHAANIDINPDADGSIIIHKFENPGGGDMNPDGTGTLPTKPIAGVGFEVCHIDGIDLLTGKTTTNTTGWEQIAAITGPQLVAAQTGNALATYALSDCTLLTDTDADGRTATDRLALGAYLVREVSAPENVIKKTDPFIVTVPTPSINGDGDGSWVYDVNVYPKNTVGNEPVKRIEDQTGETAAIGSKVKFTVDQIVPGLAADETYQKFTLNDTLDARLTPDAASVKVLLNGTALPAADYDVTVVGQKITVVLKASGLAKLAGGDVVRFAFDTTITSVGSGVIENTAYVNVNDFDFTPGTGEDPDPENPTNTVVTRWGQAVITKVDPSGNGLTGAQFEVRMGDTADCTASTTFTDVMDPADITKKLVVSSGANGTVAIPGLWVGSDSVSSTGEKTIGLSERCYQLVEIAAPAGFILPTGADAQFPVVIKPGTTANVNIDIENKQTEVPPLPLTGANGQLIMTIGGIALIGVAAGSILIARRKKSRV